MNPKINTVIQYPVPLESRSEVTNCGDLEKNMTVNIFAKQEIQGVKGIT